MDRVCEIIAIRNILDHTITSLEFLHRREAKILSWRIIHTEVQLVFVFKFVATLAEKFLNALSQSQAFRVGMVLTDKNLQCFGHT